MGVQARPPLSLSLSLSLVCGLGAEVRSCTAASIAKFCSRRSVGFHKPSQTLRATFTGFSAGPNDYPHMKVLPAAFNVLLLLRVSQRVVWGGTSNGLYQTLHRYHSWGTWTILCSPGKRSIHGEPSPPGLQIAQSRSDSYTLWR